MLGLRLRKLRTSFKLNQEELGKKIGVGKTTISQYESETRSPDTGTLQKIAEVFNVSTDYLLGRTDDPNPSQPSAPEWATTKDKRDIKKILEDDLPVMFDGVPVEDEDKQRITDLITGFLWDAKKKNKETYGRKKKGDPEQSE